ncbi:MAG: efflux RND transporter permease subunit [Pseudomonadota bacterium]
METRTFENPRIVALAILVIVAAGLSALLALGRQEDPTITNINATVTTLFPGAEPDRVEALVSSKLEDELKSIPEISVIESTSTTGVSVISVELDETVDPAIIEQVWTDARNAVDDAARAFPDGVFPPDFNADGLGAFAAIVSIAPTSDVAPFSITGRFAEALADEMRNVSGTDFVEIYGAPEEEILVRLDPARAAALGLSATEVSRLIASADAKVQAGRLQGDDADILLSVAGEIETLSRIARIPLRDDGLGVVTRLGDVAEITRGPRTPAAEHALAGGRPAILVAAQLADGLQVDAWMARLQGALAEFEATLPPSQAVTLVFDQSLYTADRLAEVGTNMAIGISLVVGVLLITLGIWAALIVAAVLPLVSLATLASMNIIGLPLHQMSVTGLIVALGLLVDAAIVMTDEIRQRLARGMARLDAVGQAVRRLAAPLLASTITTALSFTPMILLPGPAGDFVGAIAIAVVLMLTWSLIIALAVTPAIAGWTLPRGDGRGWLATGISPGRLGRMFRASISWGIHNPIRSVMLALVLPVIGFASFPTLTAQFFPGVDRDQFHIEVEYAPGTSIDKTRAGALAMDAYLRMQPGIEQVTWAIGKSAPSFYYNVVGNRDNAPEFAQALITTSSPDATAALLQPLQEDMNRTFPEARILVRGLVQGPPVDAPVEFRLVGPDLGTLRALGDNVRALLLAQEEVTVVRAGLEGGAPKINVDIDEDQAALVGLTLGDVAGQLRAALDGATGGSLLEGTEDLPVRVRLGDGLRGDLARIATLPIVPSTTSSSLAAGQFPAIPLSAIAEVSLEPAATSIRRRNGERVNTIQAFLQPGVLPEEALSAARTELAESGFALPQGYKLEFGGDSDARDETVTNLLASLGLIVTLSIATVVLTFNSFRLAAVTFVVAGLSAGLSILALAIMGYPFGITAIIGVIGSIGVSINAAIIILTGLQGNTAAAYGDRNAMVDVVMGSSRHIISTTITTFGGFLPLILAGGGFWPPFAMSIAGGVLLSTVVSFYFTPQMFALVRPRLKAQKPKDQDFEDTPELPGLRLAAE